MPGAQTSLLAPGLLPLVPSALLSPAASIGPAAAAVASSGRLAAAAVAASLTHFLS